ncbi:CG10340 [Drosophila busckii]|uniref:Fatty acyl-CoA reductase n=1 Tax=Drosophila busckii TaxID=30019 RepID=A0A0M4EDY7_DROBS|nr:fatty acyl-CoA reductase wat [Drosophila busckii]ALC46116.1 CG10340 [Drosophila busckii]
MEAFYKNKTILMSGATGFLGRVLIETILRTTAVKRIYILVRTKRGMDIQGRITDLTSDVIFSLLLKTKPNALERITAIAGDCELADLGISAGDRKLLTQEVNIVIHSAATVNFMDPLHLALDINVRGTKLMVQLAKQMTHLEAFVHVSTAFSNCPMGHVNEHFYPGNLTASYDKVLMMKEQLGAELIDEMAPVLLNKYPNSYTYTKALAEQVIQVEAQNLPICIFRPGMILPIHKGPHAGWINNLYGPIAFILGAAYGVVRLTVIDRSARSNIVPVDYCANLALASAWQAAKEAPPRNQKSSGLTTNREATIYNLVPTDKNEINWDMFFNQIQDYKEICTLPKMIWYPFTHTTNIYWLWYVGIIFYHIIPAYIVDFGLLLTGKKPRLVKTYEKIHSNLKLIKPFTRTNWTYDTRNTTRLSNSLSQEDRELYPFDMQAIDWTQYFEVALFGMREHLGKEKPTQESFMRGAKRLKLFKRLHRALQAFLVFIAGTILWQFLKLFM